MWKAYLTWQLLESASPWLSKPFAEESFDFRDKLLGGATAMKPRAALCVESTEALLGDALGRKYAERYFPPAAKAKVQEMIRTLLGVLKEDLDGLQWMGPETKKQALEKLATYDVQVGYPSKWTDYSSVVIRRDAFWANVAAGRRFDVEDDRKLIGKPTDRGVWQLPPSSPDAYIDAQLNQIVLPAGFLQPPAFDLEATDAVNYGAIGIGVAHDITHAIDVLGVSSTAQGGRGAGGRRRTSRSSRSAASAWSISTTATSSSRAFTMTASTCSARRSAISPACVWRTWH